MQQANHIATFELTLRPFTDYEGAPDLRLSKPDHPMVRVMPNLPVLDEALSLPTLDQIHALEDALTNHPNRLHLEPEHHFAPGQYLRVLRIPAGVALTGMMHVHEHLSILAEGSIRVTTDDGMKTITGPMIVHAKAMTKRAAIALTDVTWINAIPTELIDPHEIERQFTVADRAGMGILE